MAQNLLFYHLSQNFLPKASLVIFPTPLASLYQSDFLELNYNDLLTQCKSVLVNVTQEIANVVEQKPELKVIPNFGLSTTVLCNFSHVLKKLCTHQRLVFRW